MPDSSVYIDDATMDDLHDEARREFAAALERVAARAAGAGRSFDRRALANLGVMDREMIDLLFGFGLDVWREAHAESVDPVA
ncbi:MAG TPA: hypothetical protein VGN75_18690 [Kaistia sp.]|nr:hypothetical protein [Kaistia sp.]